MKNRQRGYPIGFGGMFPGQRYTDRRDIDSDYRLVNKQSGGSIVLWTAIFVLLFTIVRIIGPAFGYISGIVFFLSVLVYGYALVHKEDQPIPALVSIVGLAFLGFWILAGYAIVDRFWWPIRCDWEPRNKLVVIIFFLGLVVILFNHMYRFEYEKVDPNSQAPISPRPPGWGIMWPWKTPPAEEVEAQDVPEPEPRTVPRPYSVGTTANVTDNLDASKVDASKTVMAPSGREVAVKDLIDFVKFAPIHGATFRPWKKRRWTHNQWKDVVRVWQIYGVVSANGERTTTEIVVTDLREALTRLSSAFVEDSPTPP